MGRDLEEVLVRHPRLFPHFKPGQVDYERYQYPDYERAGEIIDPWGCKWAMAGNGIVGTVIEHPLEDWSALEDFEPPPVLPQRAQKFTRTWESVAEGVRRRRERGELAVGGLYHGFFFMRLTYLRGFENLLVDFIEKPPELYRLIDIVKGHCAAMVRHYLDFGIDVLNNGEDLGTQSASILSPSMFREFVTPVYKELFAPAREAGAAVYLHSDGHVLELMDEFAEAGIDVINPQDLVNGVDELAAAAKGRFCIDLDIDRQRIVPFGTPAEIREHVEHCIRTLGSEEGGLMLRVGIYPPTPLENLEALLSAFEDFMTVWQAEGVRS
jgi:uroporphyrinogen-III decarboxylase